MKQNLATIVFYNVENFYSKYSEDSFLPGNFIKWKAERYDKKIDQIAFCLSGIGKVETDELPSVIGLAEVENNDVLQDLVKNNYLRSGDYETLIYESLDERKINVGLIYRKKHFDLQESEPLRFVFRETNNKKSYTRDVLYVKGKLFGDVVHFFIVHLPSKIDKEVNQFKRQSILNAIRKKINTIFDKKNSEKIIIMGDFNDSPTANDIIQELNTKARRSEVNKNDLYNPMVSLQSYKRGSLVFKKQWMLFDQQIFSREFLNQDSKLRCQKTEIFDANFLKNNSGKMRGLPYRTHVGRKYFGGYSDHFPIYTILKY